MKKHTQTNRTENLKSTRSNPQTHPNQPDIDPKTNSRQYVANTTKYCREYPVYSKMLRARCRQGIQGQNDLNTMHIA